MLVITFDCILHLPIRHCFEKLPVGVTELRVLYCVSVIGRETGELTKYEQYSLHMATVVLLSKPEHFPVLC